MTALPGRDAPVTESVRANTTAGPRVSPAGVVGSCRGGSPALHGHVDRGVARASVSREPRFVRVGAFVAGPVRRPHARSPTVSARAASVASPASPASVSRPHRSRPLRRSRRLRRSVRAEPCWRRRRVRSPRGSVRPRLAHPSTCRSRRPRPVRGPRVRSPTASVRRCRVEVSQLSSASELSRPAEVAPSARPLAHSLGSSASQASVDASQRRRPRPATRSSRPLAGGLGSSVDCIRRPRCRSRQSRSGRGNRPTGTEVLFRRTPGRGRALGCGTVGCDRTRERRRAVAPGPARPGRGSGGTGGGAGAEVRAGAPAPRLPVADLPALRADLPVLPVVLGVRPRGVRGPRRGSRRIPDGAAPCALPPVEPGRGRPRSSHGSPYTEGPGGPLRRNTQ